MLLLGLSSLGPEVGLRCCRRGQELYMVQPVRERFTGKWLILVIHSFSLAEQLVAGTRRWMALGAALGALSRDERWIWSPGPTSDGCPKSVFMVDSVGRMHFSHRLNHIHLLPSSAAPQAHFWAQGGKSKQQHKEVLKAALTSG